LQAFNAKQTSSLQNQTHGATQKCSESSEIVVFQGGLCISTAIQVKSLEIRIKLDALMRSFKDQHWWIFLETECPMPTPAFAEDSQAVITCWIAEPLFDTCGELIAAEGPLAISRFCLA
jgi:hypothetical protein